MSKPLHRPDLRYTVAYGVAFALFLATEISGIRSGKPGRTFTSQTRWSEANMPGPARWGARVLILGVTTWAGIHLAEGLS